MSAVFVIFFITMVSKVSMQCTLFSSYFLRNGSFISNNNNNNNNFSDCEARVALVITYCVQYMDDIQRKQQQCSLLCSLISVSKKVVGLYLVA